MRRRRRTMRRRMRKNIGNAEKELLTKVKQEAEKAKQKEGIIKKEAEGAQRQCSKSKAYGANMLAAMNRMQDALKPSVAICMDKTYM